VVVAAPKILHHEWRLFMVEGRFCSGSHYGRYGGMEVRAHVPAAVRDFAETAARIWQPAEAYVVDVGEFRNNLKVIEVNGMNSAGFYASDIGRIVAEVSEMTARRWPGGPAGAPAPPSPPLL
jgi:hypothetical protein